MKTTTMDNIHKIYHSINILSSETFRSSEEIHCHGAVWHSSSTLGHFIVLVVSEHGPSGTVWNTTVSNYH
jgi:hypothetical protein